MLLFLLLEIVFCSLKIDHGNFNKNDQEIVYLDFSGEGGNDCLIAETPCESFSKALEISKTISASQNKVHIMILSYIQTKCNQLFEDICLDGLVSGRDNKSFLYMLPVTDVDSLSLTGYFSFSGNCAMHNLDFNFPENIDKDYCLLYSCGDSLTLKDLFLFAEYKTKKTKGSLLIICKGSLTILNCNFSFILFYYFFFLL
jgi:hypothetical protein